MTTLQRECVEAEVQLRKEKDSVVTHELHLERLAKDLSTAKEREATLLEDRCGQRGNRQLSSGTPPAVVSPGKQPLSNPSH